MKSTQTILHDLQQLERLIEVRLQAITAKDDEERVSKPVKIQFAELSPDSSFYDSSIFEKNMSGEERLIFLLALVPNIQPDFFDSIIQKYFPQGGDFPAFGGVRGTNHRGFLPTGETAQFILAGSDLSERLYIQKLFYGESILVKENILWIEQVKEGEPLMSGRIIIAQEWLGKLLTDMELQPKFSVDFPAKKITTPMSWEDLVLNAYTHNQINDIVLWMKHNAAVMNDDVLRRKIKPGYRVLFYGPSGTGKTLTATLLGKQFEKEVYRIDLSQVVSKYIGETEKNLEKVFAKAEHKDWILFFDEADALFGKRTSVQNAHDRYANQEVSYLLQRIEDYPGLLILASNFKSNMDEAFLRRFHTIIHFPSPNIQERLRLWEKTFPASFKPEPSINLFELSEKYELNGAAILNVVHYASLKAAAQNNDYISYKDLVEGIRKEFRKEERTMN